MNPTSEASPFSVRLVCRVTRLWCVVSDSTSSTHVAQCDACQRHFAGVSALSSALHREAGVALAALEPSAEQRILRAVRDDRAEQTIAANDPGRSSWRLKVPALAGVAAVTALVVASFLIQRERPPVGSTARMAAAAESAPVSPEAVLLVEALQSWSEQWSETVLPSAGQLAANNPLQEEISSVYADARAALDFLAVNFLLLTDSPAEEMIGRKSTG